MLPIKCWSNGKQTESHKDGSTNSNSKKTFVGETCKRFRTENNISIKKNVCVNVELCWELGHPPLTSFFFSMCKSKRLILCQSTNLFVSKPKYQLNQKIRPKKNEEESPSLGHVFQLYKIDVGLCYVLRMNACI